MKSTIILDDTTLPPRNDNVLEQDLSGCSPTVNLPR
jgi:hypothetical protein